MSLYVWGAGWERQLGVDDAAPTTALGAENSSNHKGNKRWCAREPRLVTSEDRCVAVACGEAHTLVATENGDASRPRGECGLRRRRGAGAFGSKWFALRRRRRTGARFASRPVSRRGAAAERVPLRVAGRPLNGCGQVLSCGRAKEGQLGRADGGKAPAKVEGLDDERVIAVACGAFHSLAVTDGGDLYEWGFLCAAAAGGDDAAAASGAAAAQELLTEEGPQELRRRVVRASEVAWAAGDGAMDSAVAATRMNARRAAVSRPRVALRRCVKSVSAGQGHTLALLRNGRVFASGCFD